PPRRSAPAGGSPPSVTLAIRPPSTSTRTRSATPRPGPSQASSAYQALTASGPGSAARELLDHGGQRPDPLKAVVEGGRLGRAVAGAGRGADEQHGRGHGGGQGAGVVAGGGGEAGRLQAGRAQGGGKAGGQVGVEADARAAGLDGQGGGEAVAAGGLLDRGLEGGDQPVECL